MTQTFYNPNLLSESDLIRGFVARRPLLDDLLDDLRRAGRDGAAQHHLLLGQRGLGKTTLLRRLAIAVRDDAALSTIWLPLGFPEEQYNVGRLADFWLNCVDALSEALDRDGRAAEAADLDARLEALGTQPEPARALELLRSEAARLNRRLVLLVDNIDLVLDRVGDQDQEWALRRILSEEKSLTIIGASSRVLEAFYEHGRAFYDFFQVHELKGLDDNETFAVLRHLADEVDSAQVKRILDEQPARLRTLRMLTGGNPRTIALLFRIFQREGNDSDAQRDLEELLDLYTPLYKARFEELPPQAQRLVDAMALHWDPLTAGDLAEKIALPVNAVSAQLKRLEDLGVVEKAPWFGEKKTGFQIAERFFNIWYLMRASRRVRRRLVWLVKFLAAWFSEEELKTRAERLLRRGAEDEMGAERYSELSFAYAQLAPGERLRERLEHAGLRAAMADDKIRATIDFSDLPPFSLDKTQRMEKMRSLAEAVPRARADWGEIDPEEFWRLLGGSLYYDAAEKDRVVSSLGELSAERVRDLYSDLAQSERRIQGLWRRKSLVSQLYETLAAGEMADPFDWTAASVVGGPDLIYAAIGGRCSPGLGQVTPADVSRAEAVFQEMLSHPDLAAFSCNGLGNLMHHNLRRYDEAEAAFRRAIALDPKYAGPWAGLGNLLEYGLSRHVEAEAAFRRSIELDPNFADPWNGLGELLQYRLNRYAEAEAAYRRAIKLDPNFADPWNNLGNVLQYRLNRYTEAEAAYRRAIELDPNDAYPWNGLGNLLQDHLRRYGEAESAYRRALELNPSSVYPFSNLGRLYFGQNKPADAAANFQRALEIDPRRIGDKVGLLDAIRDLSSKQRETALAFALKATETLPKSDDARFVLAELLVISGQWMAAAELVTPMLADPESQASIYVRQFVSATITSGRAKDLIAMFERADAHERLRPLYEALRAVEAGSENYLRRAAREVRDVAVQIYRELVAPPKP